MIKLSHEEFTKLKSNDPEIRTRLYHEYKNAVYNYLLVKTRNNIDVTADLFSEVNTAVLESLTKLKTRENLLGWVMSIAHNTYCDYVKHSVRKDKLVTKIKEDITLNPQEDTVKTENETKSHLVNTAVNNLKEKYRSIIKLKYFENKSIKELAQIYNKSENVIGGMLFRAKEALKKEVSKLEKYYR